MEPIIVILKLFESDTSTLLTVYSNFKKLINQMNQIDCEFSDKLKELVIKQWKYTYHPAMFIAYM